MKTGILPFWYFNIRWHVHMADFISLVIAGYAGKIMKDDITKNYDKYDY